MKQIVLFDDFAFSEDQLQRLQSLGEVRKELDIKSEDEWLKVVEGADIICTYGDFLLENLHNLKGVFITYPYIEMGSFDTNALEANNVVISNTEGSNRNSIAEWAVFMTLSLFRKFPSVLNVKNDIALEFSDSLEDNCALIIGKGNIGCKIGSLLEKFGMNVEYFCRGDDLQAKAVKADLLVNCLNCQPSSKNLLDLNFFQSVKPGAKFVSFARQHTFDLDGLIQSLDDGILSGAGIDCDPETPGNTSNDFYQKIVHHDKILATPHIAFATKQAQKNGLEIAVKNIESYCSGSPINVLKKI